MSSGRQVAIYWGVVALSCIALAPLALELAPQLEQGLPACPVKSISGLPCPTCGATRATLALAALSPGAALAANPLVTVAWLGVVIGGLVAPVLAASNCPLPALPNRLPISVRLGTVALIAANWLYLYRGGI